MLFGSLSPSAFCAAPTGRTVAATVVPTRTRECVPVAVARRDVCWLGAACTAAAFGIVPTASATDGPLTSSQLLTVGEYINSLDSCKKAVKNDLKPLLDLGEDRGYEAARIQLRKEPLNGIRKSCSKVIKLLEDNGSTAVAKEKDAIYSSIKKALAVIDDGCRPDATRPDFNAQLAQLESDLDAFGKGLGIAAASKLDEPNE